MSDKKTSVKVTIVGEEYTIRSSTSPEQTRAVAEYVDAAIRTVLNGKTVIDPSKAAILAALQITDELLQSRESHEEVAALMKALSADVRRWLPPTKRVSGSGPAR
ncbi:MAG: cell division protein ZapA [Gemmatimonadota bacterium]|nr:cell division protein ZapA [Gemmatimonadota bacterium]